MLTVAARILKHPRLKHYDRLVALALTVNLGRRISLPRWCFGSPTSSMHWRGW